MIYILHIMFFITFKQIFKEVKSDYYVQFQIALEKAPKAVKMFLKFRVPLWQTYDVLSTIIKPTHKGQQNRIPNYYLFISG